MSEVVVTQADKDAVAELRVHFHGRSKELYLELMSENDPNVQAFASHRQQSCAELIEALERSMTAIDDWLNIYADDMCDAERVKEAKERIGQLGTIGYIASVQQANRQALAKARNNG